MVLKGAPVNNGISFSRPDLPDNPVINLRDLILGSPARERRTVIGNGPFEIQTTEHFLAAIYGLGVTNIIIEMSGTELPGLDGSARDFVSLIERAGLVDQEPETAVIDVRSPVWCGDGSAFLAAFPDDDLKVSYTLSYNHPAIGTQFLNLTIDEGSFKREIASARTFCLEEEAAELLRRGLGKGATYENTLVMSKSGPVKNSLRFPDELVRHKILDLVGDMAVLGCRIRGHIVAIKSGHRLNMELVRKLKNGL